MLLNLTDLSDEPLQSQIARQIRAKILNGELAADASLPSIRELARQTKVSVITVQRAYEALERDGLIHARRARGFFVSGIQHERKKEMAGDRFLERIAPSLKAALAEGLAEDEIKKIINDFLSKE